MRLRVDPRTGSVLLTLPGRVSRRRALEWAATQRGWIEAALAGVPDSVPLAPGAAIPLRGEPHRIEWIEGAPRKVRVDSGHLTLGGPCEAVPSRLMRWLRQYAQDLLESETREFAAAAGVVVARVAVGDPVSRWGSCSENGTIRYSWRLILAPDWVRRATVAHEVAHRIHMNHGRDFHALVQELLGCDPAPARQWLREHGSGLHRIGRA
jgi:predicted metal-dependent hydrolase